jgi:hypothetical protein
MKNTDVVKQPIGYKISHIFQQIWRKKPQPSPGAQAYAYETLQLEPYTPIGTGIPTRHPIRATADQIYTVQGGYLVGIPTVTGQTVHQPLFDPNAPNYGYVDTSMPVGNFVEPPREYY